MTTAVIPDKFPPRLARDQVIWLTTVGQDGSPQPNPVWFLWEGATVLTFSRPDAKRLDHIKRNPRVSLHLNSTRTGGDVTVLTGTAEVLDGDPTAYPEYVAKYRRQIEQISGTVEAFAKEYSLPTRIRIDGARGF